MEMYFHYWSIHTSISVEARKEIVNLVATQEHLPRHVHCLTVAFHGRHDAVAKPTALNLQFKIPDFGTEIRNVMSQARPFI